MSKLSRKFMRKRADNRYQIISRFNTLSDNQMIFKQRLVQTGSIATSAIGVIPQVLGMNPAGTTEWSSLSALYDEFRVLAIRLYLIPVQQGTVTNLNGSVVIVYDNDDSTALTTIGGALEYDNAVVASAIWYQTTVKAQSVEWARPTSGGNTAVPWVDVAAPSGSNGSIKFYSSALTASTTYYSYNLEYFIEFRGRR
jgi:hypothetical protein